ncbi:hypothetical protein FHR22_003717 [Sphingopyxis panaciterrae]|uniref:hypothetical protein n=1 Tax=Sphingopyxis panaciterrae TaxID=363841 RepID=UPI001423FC37|nr:hypothetical protein [Sphingopyxis panaciterrae]NIJ38983.1 hypothetical protein [Sphingopyxis panaciterrae]
MHIMKKAAVSIAAASMILSPMAASAAPALDSARATTAADGTNELSGSSWLPALLAVLVIAGGIWLIADNDDDAPVSP